MKALLLSLLILTLFSCENDTPSTEESTKNNTISVEPTPSQIENTTDTTEVVTTQDKEPESKYHYDQDWEIFKTAVLTKDIQGMAAFASSDEIDSEALLNSFSDESFLKKLNSTTYNELTTEEQGDHTYLVFTAIASGSDEEDNEYESGIYLYFTQGETSLLLDYYLLAG